MVFIGSNASQPACAYARADRVAGWEHAVCFSGTAQSTPGLPSTEPFGAECFDPELSAEGLMVEALSRSPAPGMNGREYKDAAVAASLTKKTACGVAREYHTPWGVDRRAS